MEVAHTSIICSWSLLVCSSFCHSIIRLLACLFAWWFVRFFVRSFFRLFFPIVPLLRSFVQYFASGGLLSFGFGLLRPAEQCCATTCCALRCLAMFAWGLLCIVVPCCAFCAFRCLIMLRYASPYPALPCDVLRYLHLDMPQKQKQRKNTCVFSCCYCCRSHSLLCI